MSRTDETESLDNRNKGFWSELCGSSFAKFLGIKGTSLEDLKKFDLAYLDFYPYLLRHVPVETFSGLRVLEVGLGYGTLGQKIAESGADYYGFDISAGPVSMMQHRLHMHGLKGHVRQGSMLACPFPDAFFDAVVSIGCYHHTGDVKRCFDETFRVLKPGGVAYLMVYNRFSYRQWLYWPMITLKAAINNHNFDSIPTATERQRAAYDTDQEGNAAPETVFLSISQLRVMLKNYSIVRTSKENWGGLSIKGIKLLPRKPLLDVIGPLCGLDTYVFARK